jgi:GT2 family glycosyltransferase
MLEPDSSFQNAGADSAVAEQIGAAEDYQILCLIPRFSPSRPEDLEELVQYLQSDGIHPLILANSSSVVAQCEDRGLDFFTTFENPGFGACINRAVSIEGWNGYSAIMILNDDLDIMSESASVRESVSEAELQRPTIIHLGSESQKRVPGMAEVFLNFSLLGAVLRRLGWRSRSTFCRRGWYRSFSAVLITRQAWKSIGTFDESMTFTFEDADYVRRSALNGVYIRALDIPLFSHMHSVTSGRYVREVLPVSVMSAVGYLNKWQSIGRGRGTVLLVTALAIRSLVCIGRRDRIAQWSAIGHSVRWLLLRKCSPRLPDFESH